MPSDLNACATRVVPVKRSTAVRAPDARAIAASAGTNRRFVSTVSVGSVRRTREVELTKTVGAVHPDDQLLTIPQHTLLFRARRGTAIALAVSDVFAEGSDLESLQAKNTRAPLEGDEASSFKKLLSASAYISAFSLASYLFQLIDSDGEAPNDARTAIS